MATKTTLNAQGGGNIRQRPNGLWEARYTVGRDPGTGKQIQKSIYGATQKEVRQKLSKVTTEIDEGIYFVPSKIMVGTWLDAWLAEYTVDVKPATFISYKTHVKNNLRPYIGGVKLADLDTVTIQKLYNSLLHGKDEREPLSAKTVKDLQGVLHRALNQAVELGLIRTNPSTACKWPRAEKPKIYPLADENVAKFLNVIRGDCCESVFRVGLFTGMRKGELLGLMWECVHFGDNTILVDKQLQRDYEKRGGYHFILPKNGKARLITAAPAVMSLLAAQKAQQEVWRQSAGSAWEDSGLVFTNEIGQHLSPITVGKHCKRALTVIGQATVRLGHNMKQVVVKRLLKQEDSTLNRQFEDFAGFYGFKPVLCRPYRGQTKGKVERTVRFVRECEACPWAQFHDWNRVQQPG